MIVGLCYGVWVIIFPHFGQCMWRKEDCESQPETLASFFGQDVAATGARVRVFGHLCLSFFVEFYEVSRCPLWDSMLY